MTVRGLMKWFAVCALALGAASLVAPLSSAQGDAQKLYTAKCASCHGADAKGVDQNPRLAGQVYRYTIKVLTNWQKAHAGKGTNAHNLTNPQIEAVAAFLSHQK